MHQPALCAVAGTAIAASRNVVVVQSIDLSGPNGSIGRDYVAGITTYFDGINQKGGVKGRKIAYIVKDDRGSAGDSAANVSALIRDAGADYVLGAIGTSANRAILSTPAFARSRHQLFAPLADSSATASARAVFWRPSIESELLHLLTHFEKLGVSQVGIALQLLPDNTRAFEFLKSEIKKRNMRLAGVANITAHPEELNTQAQRLAQSGPRLVISIGDTIAMAQFLRAYRAHDGSTFVAGTSLVNLTTLSEIAGRRATEWTVFSQVVPNPARAVSALQSEHIDMMKRFRDEPVSSLTLEGYAVAKTMVSLLQIDETSSAPLAGKWGKLDLGGMIVAAPQQGTNLSSFVGIALFRPDGSLMF
ncbi:ABC transporter substrate-binding protein [Massilia sp. PAMC28688]|nr:ABC transporter substrate-binding protein [Massilia sp. PAMC28688]